MLAFELEPLISVIWLEYAIEENAVLLTNFHESETQNYQ